MKIVGDVIQDGLPGHFNAYFTVKKDGPVKRIEDMKGRRAAINALGSPVWMELHVALARHGLSDKDYTVIEAQFPNMFAMIEADKVDIVPVISPKLAAAFNATGRYARFSRPRRRSAPTRRRCGRCARISSPRTAPR